MLQNVKSENGAKSDYNHACLPYKKNINSIRFFQFPMCKSNPNKVIAIRTCTNSSLRFWPLSAKNGC